ncbi:hypothetical protein [Actinomadura yumaensis]|uniref:LytR/CpsA/Psr regulator C-terminal domain-containing protein n=2 Tax=Actinomadura TaxID=1988 RepID=A0ABW2CL36_9ACTN|nr:hypothetical protein [Actinomadura sp. J1-007]
MKRRRSSLTVLLAGWLFADMLLALTIVMLGAEAPPKAEAYPSGGASPSKSPCAAQVRGVKSKPALAKFPVSPGASGRTLVAQVKKGLRKQASGFADKRAGMVLTFGGNGGSGQGVALASRVNTALREAYPSVFQSAATRNFHDLAASAGSISMEIYFINNGCDKKGS